MKKVLIIAGIFLLAGCKPLPSEVEKSAPAPTQASVQVSSIEAQAAVTTEVEEPESNQPKPVIDEDITPNNRVISVSTISDNYQSVKRVEYPDATCFVVMNTKSWEGSISCLRK